MTTEVPSRGARREVFRTALTNASLRRVTVAFLLFNIAEWADWIAILVWGYNRDGARGASTIALLQLVPAGLLAPSVAVLFGRLAAHWALPLGYGAQAVGFLATGAVLLADAPFAVVAVVSILTTLAVTTTRPTHNTLLPLISRTTGELTAGNTAGGATEAAAAFLGPALAGVIMAGWELGWVQVVLAVGMGLAMLLTWRLPVERADGPAPTGDEEAGAGVGGDLRTVVGNRSARLLGYVVTAEYVLVGMLDILLVVLALDLLTMDQGGPGLLNSALGIGGLVGATVTVTLVGRRRLGGVVVVAAVVAGLPIALVGLMSLPITAMALIAVAGAGKVFYDVASRTLVQRAIPQRLLSAVFGLYEGATMVGLALGSLLAPILVALLGVRGAFAVAGLFLPVVALGALPGVRRMDGVSSATAASFDLLRAIPMLAVLTPDVLEGLARAAVAVHQPTGAIIVREGEYGDRFYVIESGRVRVSQGGTTVNELGPGDYFGELALLHDLPRTATVTATADTHLLSLDRAPFLLAVTGVSQAIGAAADHAAGYRQADQP
ncbi:MAG TPA: cyclic nucleotide-binding domain-containing protein [Candidatus Nanopelagicales bacterium]|nr:cyclic nucleotide-binding domain-containing protein [Candidatus Nanopelagicales bacterium]